MDEQEFVDWLQGALDWCPDDTMDYCMLMQWVDGGGYNQMIDMLYYAYAALQDWQASDPNGFLTGVSEDLVQQLEAVVEYIESII